jgi:hypothetical protein
LTLGVFAFFLAVFFEAAFAGAFVEDETESAVFVRAGDAAGVVIGAGGGVLPGCWASKPVEKNAAKINQQFIFI